MTYEDILIAKAWMALKPFVKTGGFTLRSGRKSDIYVDVKSALLSKDSMDIMKAMDHVISRMEFGEGTTYPPHFIGYEYGGAIMCAAYTAVMCRPSTVIRGENKKHGLGNKPIGELGAQGAPLVILEDVVTTEGSVKECIMHCFDHGYAVDVPHIAVVVDRRKEEDVTLKCHSLFTEADIRQRCGLI